MPQFLFYVSTLVALRMSRVWPYPLGLSCVSRLHTLFNRQANHIIYFTYPQTRNLEECEEVWIRIADPLLESRDLNQSKSNQIRKFLNKTLFEIPQ